MVVAGEDALFGARLVIADFGVVVAARASPKRATNSTTVAGKIVFIETIVEFFCRRARLVFSRLMS